MDLKLHQIAGNGRKCVYYGNPRKANVQNYHIDYVKLNFHFDYLHSVYSNNRMIWSLFYFHHNLSHLL